MCLFSAGGKQEEDRALGGVQVTWSQLRLQDGAEARRRGREGSQGEPALSSPLRGREEPGSPQEEEIDQISGLWEDACTCPPWAVQEREEMLSQCRETQATAGEGFYLNSDQTTLLLQNALGPPEKESQFLSRPLSLKKRSGLRAGMGNTFCLSPPTLPPTEFEGLFAYQVLKTGSLRSQPVSPVWERAGNVPDAYRLRSPQLGGLGTESRAG